MTNYLSQLFTAEKSYAALHQSLAESGCAVAFSGLSPTKKSLLLSALVSENPCLLYVASDEREAERIRRELAALLAETVPFFPMNDYVFTEISSHSREWEGERMATLGALARGVRAVVTTCDAVCRRTPPRSELERGSISVKVGDTLPVAKLVSILTAGGYERADLVEGAGQFSVRGGIIDFFPPDCEAPVRLELFGDDVDTMSYFDLINQRRTEEITQATLTPAREVTQDSARLVSGIEGELAALSRKRSAAAVTAREVLSHDLELAKSGILPDCTDRFYNLLHEKSSSIFDYLPQGALVIFSETARQKERLSSFHRLYLEDVKFALETGRLTENLAKNLALSPSEFWGEAARFRTIFLDTLPHTAFPIAVTGIIKEQGGTPASCGGNTMLLCGEVSDYISRGYTVLALCTGERRANNLLEILRQNKLAASLIVPEDDGAGAGLFPLPARGHIGVYDIPILGGADFREQKIALITDGLPATKQKKRRSKPAKNAGERVRTYSDVRVGDYVVHATYGVGQYLGINKLTVDGVTKDYLKIKYAGTDVLYVPAAQLDLVYKYLAAGDRERVKLSKMGGGEWIKTTARVKKAVAEMADELITLYAAREQVEGYAFQADTEWQKEFEQRFDFDETEDQLRCIREIKADMQRPAPMERLLCGDVGFGKTEVALRAAFKCAEEGKQCAILVPTTILATQHYNTILRRFSGYPIKAEVLSRFRTPAQQTEILRELRAGMVDIVVGTHRLIQKDVKFKDLGLVIIDEEQRFGVSHKEKLKEMTRNVDVLTLTATPIPRTLNMALTGIRDMSVIEEAPRSRTPVQTYVIEHDMSLIAEAIRKELRRGGQVFYLHNRVDTIERTAAKLAALLPDAHIDVGHGQMGDDALSQVWEGVVSGETDLLVCTTIIETGVDIPNANTLIIEDADRMGLSQLYQIRGRVGRSDRRAYVYFTYRRGKVLTEDATKRLEAIREFTEFGSGFKIAMRDLEIRGAGNLLGAQQHGHMEAVGYDMYVKLLDEAVAQRRGEKRTETECAVDLFVDAHIPDSYIESAEQRIDMYKKIASIASEEDMTDVVDEMCDRYGDLPRPVYTLCRIAYLRGLAGALGIPAISSASGQSVSLSAAALSFETVSRLIATAGKGLFYSAGDSPQLTISLKNGEDMLTRTTAVLVTLAEITAKKG